MAAFPTDALTQHPPDFRLARGGGAAAFLSQAVLGEAQAELASLGYVLKDAHTSAWDEDALLSDLASTLGFPNYYGRNWPALAECLDDFAAGEFGWDVQATGVAVSLGGFGEFARREPRLAHHLVSYLVAASREGLLFGHRLLWLLQVDDPHFRLEPVGAVTVPWNDRERLDVHRR